MKLSQKERIGEYLKKGGRLTPLSALQRFGCLRLSGRIWELKGEGVNVKTAPKRVGDKIVAEYYIL